MKAKRPGPGRPRLPNGWHAYSPTVSIRGIDDELHRAVQTFAEERQMHLGEAYNVMLYHALRHFVGFDMPVG